MTLKGTFGALAAHMPDLLRLRNGTLLPGEAPPLLASLGLADETGLTRKGEKALACLLNLADLLDLPYA
ncbi:hypothetical protein Dgeo_3066 (plasmid) [Deinococcus geothermalis DSM 11300]|uniref:Uncharacterized protein n=1 Tax=Deinococcus geothermalis (strain DSM 11300 / CIP 105573 / AG-3a) TaxID=319795 RepID=A8ZRJ8_DEIGD|nr:hypothetical protein [Deinococcus geothermalis]ABW35107.1 hypothetical protein Dgeo_3066 [Deinococcus geothermalis DSM 11300]